MSLIDTQDIKLYRPSEIVILCTGSQGEPAAALSRIASGEHKDIHIAQGDTVVFSSSAIPGNGLMIARMINLLTRCGADVVTNSILSDIHSSGHPSRQELRLTLKLFKPKHFMPMHGEYRMLLLHAQLAQSLGIPADKTFVLDNGDCLTLHRHKVTRGYQVEHGNTYIDGKDINGLADPVMADRRILTEDGMYAIALSIDASTNKLLVPPKFYSLGTIHANFAQEIEDCRLLVEKAVREKLMGKTNFAELKNLVRTIASDFILKKTNRQPMIIPVIMSKN